MEKILVTGANGYLGAQLCRNLSQQGYRVSGLCYPVIPSDKNWQQCFEELFVFDIRDEEKLKEIADKDFGTIIHLVSLDHHQSSDRPDFVASINVMPTWNLLHIFSKKGLKKFIYFSTIHVYGSDLKGVITEEHPTNCTNPYALTHYLGENICRYYAENSDVKCMIARLSNSYGAPVFSDNNCWWLVVNDLCRNAFLNKQILLQSDGSPLRDFIHGSDVCKAVEVLLEKGENKQIYHLNSGTTYAVLELAEIVQRVYRTLYGETIPVSTSTQNSVCDFSVFSSKEKYSIANQKLTQLGFFPACSIEQGVEQLFRYLELCSTEK